MNREIKFRAWTGKYMLDSAYGDWVSFDGIPYTEAEQRNSRNIEIKKAKDYVLMQYTGLKDKNGRECYEGDVVQNFLTGHHGQVVFSSKFACFNVFDEDNKWVCSMGAMSGDGFSILGNAYQNPEML